MKTKGEIDSIFQNFHKMIKIQFETYIKDLHSDNWGEGSTYFLVCKHTWLIVVLNIKLLALALPNKMEWLNARIGIS